jgi:tetratricopeptide (TPR) repeat protein
MIAKLFRLMSCGLFLIILTVLIGCATTSKVKVERWKPAELNISNYKKVAIGEIKGVNGDGIADLLAHALVATNRFEVLDRSNINQIIKEQRISASAQFEPATAVALGKMIGSAILFVGNVNRREYKQNQGMEQSTCIDDKYRPINCTKITITGIWSNQITIKGIDTSTGRIIATKTVQWGTKTSVSSDKGMPNINWDPEAVLVEMDKIVVNKFMQMIAPYTVSEEVELFTDEKLPELGRGVTYARYGEWEKAIDNIKEGSRKADDNPGFSAQLRARAHYDLGIALGYSGRYEEGIREIEKAINIEAEEVYFKEIQKIKSFHNDSERLRKQGQDAS